MNLKQKLWWAQHKTDVYKYGTTFTLILIVTISIIYFTYSKFSSSNEATMYETTVEPFIKNDYFIASYIDGEWSNEIPGKEDGYIVDKVVCDNGATGTWDNEEWGINIRNATQKIKCGVYFKQATVILGKAIEDESQIATDDPDNNIRYIGKDPNNYVYFNCNDYLNQSDSTCEKWRIIGVFKNMTKEDSTKEDLVKIIRNDSIGAIDWDAGTAVSNVQNTSNSKLDSKTNNLLSLQQTRSKDYRIMFTAPEPVPNGENDWSKSSLQTTLNGTYYNGTYATGAFKNATTRNAIESVVWNLGGLSSSQNATNAFYSAERETTVYSGHTTTWTGKVGLMYPSDYGYATAGGTTTNRATCLITNLGYGGWNNVSDCYNNDYLYKSSYYQWTLTPYSSSTNSVFGVFTDGYTTTGPAYVYYHARPSVYLKSSVSISSGDGSSSNPYQLKLD